MALDPELTKNWLDFESFKRKYQRVPVEEYPNNVLTSIPEPVVSVRITTYQHVEFIRDAIEGVLMQKTNFPFEIIIGDDESTDGTREICMEYAEKHPDKIRLFLHKRENNIAILGKASHIFQFTYNSFNLRGKYVAGCSGDDYWTDPKKLQKQVKCLDANRDVSLCYHDYVECIDRVLSSTSKCKFPMPCTAMIKNIFDRIPTEFMCMINEDLFIYLVLESSGRRKYMGDIGASVYRVSTESLWGQKANEEKIENVLLTRKMLYEMFKGTNLEKKAGRLVAALVHSKAKSIRWKNPLKYIHLFAEHEVLTYLPSLYKKIVVSKINHLLAGSKCLKGHKLHSLSVL